MKTEEVVVRGIAAGGSGVADLADGRVVFVPRTAPGDRVRIRIEKSKARWAVASVVSMPEPSDQRVDAPCPLYDTCGGCHLQHIPYELQLAAKGQFIADALARIGGLSDTEAPEVVASPETLGYRNRVTYTLRRLRGGYIVAGFHGLGRPGHVIDVNGQCLLPDASLRSAWTAVRAAWGEGARNLPMAGRLQLTLRVVDGGVCLVVDGGAGGWDAEPLLAAVSDLVAVYHLPDEEGDVVLSAGRAVEGGGVAFEQVNRGAADLLRAYVLHVVGEIGEPAAAIDAYCGTGEYGRGLVERGWTVVGVESDAQAAAMAEGTSGFQIVKGKVEETLSELLSTDLLLVNPPRSGLHADIPPLILANPPGHVLYVSCDPGTLARDLRALADGYDVTSVRGFDLFPQTAHVEAVVLLTRKEDAS